ncbi:MAG TPA: branched-chain amino acid ABC transporter permease [Candidatus Cryosericum sp.]|nr:branched-chain amino acid ABC transporter permease [Candidatus Cryosericum sp.]
MIYLQSLLDGIMLGGVYATVAVGLSLAFGVMNILNWAHGELLMVSMFISYLLITYLKIDPYLTLFVNVVVMFGVGYLLQKNVFSNILKKDKDKEPMSVLIATSGLGMILISVATMLFGSNAMSAQSQYSGKTIWLGEIMISIPRSISFAIAILATIGLYLLLQKTELGRSLRATAQNREVAKLMGINTDRAYNIAFGLSLALVGIAAALLVPNYSVYPKVGGSFGLKAFVIVLLGGKGNVPGALVGGLAIGIIERLSAILWNESYALLLVYALFIIILLVMPDGIFSVKKRRKAA